MLPMALFLHPPGKLQTARLVPHRHCTDKAADIIYRLASEVNARKGVKVDGASYTRTSAVQMRASARNPDDAVLGKELTWLAGDVADV